MWYYVYVLQSVDYPDQIYVGYTTDIDRRLEEHNDGRSSSTKPYIPWELVFFEGYKYRWKAKQREQYFKTSKGKRALKLMLKDVLY